MLGGVVPSAGSRRRTGRSNYDPGSAAATQPPKAARFPPPYRKEERRDTSAASTLEVRPTSCAISAEVYRADRAFVNRDGRSRAPAEGVDRIQRCDYNVITSRRWNVIKTRLVQIGNSRGVRLPKPVIEEAGLSDEVELQVRDGAVVIRSLRAPRSGWAEAARALRGSGADVLLDPPTPTRFDEKEWEW